MAIVHVPGRRPFSQNLVHVYKDGHLVKTAPLRCPSLSEVCQAGFGEVWVAGQPWTGWALEPLFPFPHPTGFSLWGLCSLGGSLRKVEPQAVT